MHAAWLLLFMVSGHTSYGSYFINWSDATRLCKTDWLSMETKAKRSINHMKYDPIPWKGEVMRRAPQMLHINTDAAGNVHNPDQIFGGKKVEFFFWGNRFSNHKWKKKHGRAIRTQARKPNDGKTEMEPLPVARVSGPTLAQTRCTGYGLHSFITAWKVQGCVLPCGNGAPIRSCTNAKT